MLSLPRLIKILYIRLSHFCSFCLFHHSFLMLSDYPELKPLYYAFLPSRMMITVLKSIPIGFAFQVLDDKEDFDISKKYPFCMDLKHRETQKSIWEYSKYFIIRDISISTSERVIEHLVVNSTDAHFSKKIFKSVRQSSLNKDKRMSRSEASCAMFWTSMRCCFAYHISMFVFNEMVLIVSWVRQHYRRNEPKSLEDQPTRRLSRRHGGGEITVGSFAKRTMKNLVVCVVAIVAEAVGASIGTYFSPGYGTLICDRLFANAPYIL